MYDSCGIPIPRTYFDPHGPTHSSPSPNAEATFVKSFILDAEDFASMDPQKIIDEYQRMQKAADATDSDSSDAVKGLRTAQARIAANWHGAAADAFAGQMTTIEQFMEQQQERLVYAMQAMGTAFGLTVQFRQSYHDLAVKTYNACEAVIANRPAEPSVNSFMMALGSKMVGIGVSAVGAKNTKDLLKVGVEKFKEMFDSAREQASVDGGDAPAVLGSYVNLRDRLRGEFEAGLGQLRNWLDNQRSVYFSLNVPILEPLPVYADVHSPDFSYAKFFNDGHDPDTYTPRVEEQRKKFAEEHPRADSPIHRRLKGEE
jgi:uncharacterized protein YukE